MDNNKIDIAACCGRLNIIKILISKGFRPTKGAIEYSYMNNHIDCLEYLISINAPCDYNYINDISYGDSDIDKRGIELLNNYHIVHNLAVG